MPKTRTRRIYIRRPRRSRGRNSFSLPLAVIGGFAPLGMDLYNGIKYSGAGGAVTVLQRDLLAYDPEKQEFNPYWALRRGYGPILLGILIHKFIGGRLGVNRSLARAGVPFIRL